MAKRDFYEVLGIDRGADAREIKRAYRKLAKKYHPDTNPGDQQAEQKFKEVTEAYNVLSDEEKKKLYDQFGMAAFEEGFDSARKGRDSSYNGFYGQGGSRGFGDFDFGRGGNGSYREYHFENGDMDDIFGDMFGNMFRGGQDRGFSEKGRDLQSEVSISFYEAVFGCDRVLQLSSGEADGRIQKLQVHIPAGIENGKSIRLKGKGKPGYGGGAPGDLLLKVQVEPKAGWDRKGADLYTTEEIPFITAVLGGEAKFSTLYGDVMCRIPAGTQSGGRIRLRGKGAPSVKNPSVKGDQYVTVQIQVPREVSPEAAKKLREYQQAMKGSRAGKRGSAA